MNKYIDVKGIKVKREISIGMLMLLFILSMLLNLFIYNAFADISNRSFVAIIVYLILFLKITLVDRWLLSIPTLHYIGKTFDVVLAVNAVSVQRPSLIVTLLLLVVIIDAALKKGSKGAKVASICGLAVYLELLFFEYLKNADMIKDIKFFISNIAVLMFVSLSTYRLALKKDKEETNIKSEFEELQAFKGESVHASAEAKCQLNDLETRNKKMSRELARFSTLQQINQVVNSTLKLEDLLKLVVDMIIGVIGVKYCTIFLKNDSLEKVSIGSTNIKDEETLKNLKEKIALKLFRVLEGGQKVLSNNIDTYTYPGALSRGIESVLFIPIYKGDKVLGLIIAEHVLENGMDVESKKLIEAIANQIGVAIENARLYDEMKMIATTDGLTRVYNRMYFQQNYIKIFEEAKVNNQPLSAMMMDIDFFKKFNDNYGHDFGDEVLKSIAQLIKNNLDSNGLIARYGGEEFIVLFKNTTLDDGFKKADELRKKIESNIVQFNGKAVKVTVSMGVSEFPHVVSNNRELLKSADEALYEAKDSGRNCVRRGFAVTNLVE